LSDLSDEDVAVKRNKLLKNLVMDAQNNDIVEEHKEQQNNMSYEELSMKQIDKPDRNSILQNHLID